MVLSWVSNPPRSDSSCYCSSITSNVTAAAALRGCWDKTRHTILYQQQQQHLVWMVQFSKGTQGSVLFGYRRLLLVA